MSDHVALERWFERTPNHAVSPETAYENAVELEHITDYFTDNGGQTPDRCRYFEGDGYGIVFIIRDGVIVTVYDVADVTHPGVRSYINGVWNAWG